MYALLRPATRWLTILVLVLLAGCGTPAPTGPQAHGAAAIAAPDAHAAAAGRQALEQGGNAVDAAVAMAFTLAVTYPEAGNLGGGGFMLAWIDGQPAFLDYREVAPAAAHRDMFLDEQGEPVASASLVGHRAVAVPGTVAGLHEAHLRHGRLPWPDLLAPAIALAERGFEVDPLLASRIADKRERLAGTGFERQFGALRAGTWFRQPELAAVLRDIAAQGAAGFHAGRTARLIEAEMQRGGGLVSAADLAAYRPRWRTPLRMKWREFEVLAAPPPSSGGIAVLQMLRLRDLRAADFAGLAHNSPQYVHLLAEISKRAFADRAEYLGDPDFVDVPVAALLDDDYLARRAAGISAASITPTDSVRPGLEGRSTTHFSVVDRDGNAVANTYTLNTNFGSGVVVGGAGFLLNNEMDDFAAKAGVANYYGVVGADANAIAPGKRMLSSMSPTILLKDGRVELVTGSPGGSTIISSVFQCIVNVVDFGMDADEAVAATRVHHQLLPADLVTHSVHRPLAAATVAELRRRGYRVEPHDWDFGDLQLIVRDGDRWRAASDPRGRGLALVLD